MLETTSRSVITSLLNASVDLLAPQEVWASWGIAFVLKMPLHPEEYLFTMFAKLS